MQNDAPGQGPKRRGIYLLPNLFTVGALFAGFYAIVAATKHQYDVAGMAIFIAMLLDGLDGRIARLTGTMSEFGAQLDSMSDMVCFGVTPALVLYSWSLSSLGKAGWLAAFLYTMCTAIRLARFNSSDQQKDKRYFRGLATPAAAGLVASMTWAATKYGLNAHNMHYAIAVGIVTVLLALLKVSNIPFRSFKDLDFKNRVPFMAVVLIVLIFVLISFDPPDVFLTIFSLYALSGPVGWLWNLRHHRKES